MKELIQLNNEVGEMPRFINHLSARVWLKERLKSRFIMVGSEIKNNVKFYEYHLIHDKLAYAHTLNAIREGNPYNKGEFLNSFSVFEISEEGFIFQKEGTNVYDLSDKGNGHRLYLKSND